MIKAKEARMKLGFTQKQMAKACNTHEMTISKWETEERIPRGQAIRLIETLLWLKSRGWVDEYMEKFCDK